MASIGGLSSNASTNSASSLRGYGGLASGLDRDSLIESMTYATTSKIQKQQQAKQKITWTQEAMRGITDKLYNFSQSFISYTSPKSLLSTKLFSSNQITALGENSKYIGVSGSSSLAKSMSIAGVKQMASDAKCNFTGAASDQKLASGGIDQDLSTLNDYSTVAGTSFTVKYGSKYYSVSLPENNEDYKYDTLSDVAASINKAMGEISVGDGKTLADAMTAIDDGVMLAFANMDTAGNTLTLTGSSDNLLANLGFHLGEDNKGIEITTSGVRGTTSPKLTEQKSVADQIGGKQICFTYNGKTEWIQLASAADLKDPTKGNNDLDYLVSDLQAKLDKAFGAGRINVKADSTATPGQSSLSFKTTVPTNNNSIVEDKSSVLSLAAGERGLLGQYGALTGLSAGDSNRLNLESSWTKSGLKHMEGMTDAQIAALPDEDTLKINGTEIKIKKGMSLTDIMDAINASDAGVKASYLAEGDRFVLTSTENGASGKIEIDSDQGIDQLLFGVKGTDYEVQEGKDAIIAVKYAGSDTPVEVTRGSNSFNLNGLTVTVKGEFGYNSGVLDPAAEAITFDVTMNTEPAVTAVKEMVDAFNEIVKLVNDEVSTKPNRKYDPLTAEQEDEMSESQINAWNEKAKAGMLFNDSDIRGLADALRTIISGDASNMQKMGLSVSTDYSDNGKLVFDEEAFKKALETDPDGVINAFTRPSEKDANGNVTDAGGVMVRLQTIMEKYASTTGATKGILIERAGSKYAPTSILTNSMQKQLDAIDKEIDRLTDKLSVEQDRYISQFTNLERLISQMNSQSSWLASALGGA